MPDRLHLPPLAPSVETDGEVRLRATMRARSIGLGLLTIIALVGVRGAQLAVQPSDKTLLAAAVQRWDMVMEQAPRGQIVDRNGHRLAVSRAAANVVADPSRVRVGEVNELARGLAPLLDRPEPWLKERLLRSERRYERLAVDLHPQAAQQAVAKHDALYLEEPPVRYYPEGKLASHIIGFVDAEGTGREGLEADLESYLRGGTILRHHRRDRYGYSVDDLGERAASHAGMTVHLTLDRSIQRLAEIALAGVMDLTEAEGASAVVVEVETGNVLALANAPTFDPNHVSRRAKDRRNRAVEYALEPGSVFKPFTVAAALQVGELQPHTELDCAPPLVFGSKSISDSHPMGACTPRMLLAQSSNIGAARLAHRVGAERFLTFLRAFGFGSRTGVGLPAESAGIVRGADRLTDLGLANVAFGQGIAVTPLQLAMAVAALGNGGRLMRARLVARVVDVHGIPEKITRPEVVGQPVEARHANAVVEMMVGVTEDDGGTGHAARIAGYQVAGKTGTAQKASPRGGYGLDRVASFVALVPADDPQVAIVVCVDGPRVGSRSGGVVAAPVVAEIAEGTMRHLVRERRGADLGAALARLTPAPHAAKAANGALTWAGPGWRVPDLSGHVLRDATVVLAAADLRLVAEGHGRVVAQQPSPGTIVPSGGQVALTLR